MDHLQNETELRPGRHQWSGANGLLQLRSSLRCTAPNPSSFRAEARLLTAAGITLSDWRSSQLSGEGAADPRAGGLELTVVLAGSVQQRAASSSWDADPRAVYLVRRGEPRRWSFAHNTHLRLIRIPAELVPAHLRAPDAVPSGPLPQTKLVQGFASALTQGVSASIDRDQVPAHLAHGLRSLALAVLEELAPEDPWAGDELRDRIIGHIDRHLGETSLGPRSIADAFGISLRWVHQCFNGEGTTVARYIRVRRVDAVAEHLRTEAQTPRLSALAVRFGFSGREQLARSFRWRYGCIIGEFHAAIAAGRNPQPVEPAPAAPDRFDAA